MAGGSRADTADRLRGIDIVSANMSLMGATWQLTTEETGNQIERYKRLAQLDAVGAYYDFCIIDNPPDIGLNVVNALTVTDEVIVPVKIDEWALGGLRHSGRSDRGTQDSLTRRCVCWAFWLRHIRTRTERQPGGSG